MEYLLWDISFANLNMLLLSIPSYGSEDEKGGEQKPGKKAKTTDEQMKEEVARLFF